MSARIHFVSNYEKLPLAFEPNQGQADSRVKFVARGKGYNLFITSQEAVLSLENARVPLTPFPGKGSKPKGSPDPARDRLPPTVLRLKLEGAQSDPNFESLGQLPGISNYFIGPDPGQWHTRIPQYAKVAVHSPYPGVDMVYYGNQGKLEYDFVVGPGTEPGSIHMRVDGAQTVRVNEKGDLELGTGRGTVVFRAPEVYQEDQGQKIQREGRFKLEEGNRVGFEVGDYDRAKDLVIDPVVDYSTYLSGNVFGNISQCLAVAADAAGDAYVTGNTGCLNFPTTPAAFEPTPTGGVINTVCGIVTKFNPSGSALLYSTYLGGNLNTTGFAIAVDGAGNAYVAGSADGNFPVTPGAYETAIPPGYQTPFVSKLDPTGSTLLYSTYVGSNGLFYGIALDSSEDAYLTGFSYAAAFPTTPGCYEPNNPTGPALEHAVVCELNPTASALLYSTYLAGTTGEEGLAIALDSSNNAYVTGYTYSANFPITPGAFQAVLTGFTDIFVSKLTLGGKGPADLAYSTFLDGGPNNSDEGGYGIAVDSAGNAYVTGETTSGAFPTTSGAFQTASSAPYNAFVAKLNPSGSGLVYATYLGGTGGTFQYGSNIALDSLGDAYITGETRSNNYPVTPDAFQPTLKGGINAMVSVLDPTGANLLYSTYLGGSNLDVGEGIALDPSGAIYVTGISFSADFPTTSGAFQTAYTNGEAGFVVKFASLVSGAETPTPTFTPTASATSTPSNSPTPSPTATATLTPINTATATASSTVSPSPTRAPVATGTPSPTPVYGCDDFIVGKNLFHPAQGPVTLQVDLCGYPGAYSLVIYNSAGEHIKTLDNGSLNGPLHQSYSWDGTNEYGDPCASGVYLLRLQGPNQQEIKRILLVR